MIKRKTGFVLQREVYARLASSLYCGEIRNHLFFNTRLTSLPRVCRPYNVQPIPRILFIVAAE
ncbi:hypothetical protein EMIT043CA1_50346 [Pseudomonas brassicacearum]